MTELSTLLWFKRDLRVSDHAALSWAIDMGQPVLPIYVVEPDYWALPDTSARQWDFIAECVTDLRAQLARLGQPLIVRVGNVVDVFERVRRDIPFDRIISHEETGNLWTYRRDQAVTRWAHCSGIMWKQLSQSGVTRRLSSRNGWAAAREKYVRGHIVATPTAMQPLKIDPGHIPTSHELGMICDPCAARQIGGRSYAMSTLGGFLTQRGRTYRKDMSSPLLGEGSCSRLSPYLALGVISGREAAQATAARKLEVKGTRDGWGGSLSSFTSRLAWRDHFMQKLEDAPHIETHCLHSAYQEIRQGSDPDRLQAWSEGQTGLPFVDACMRYLVHTGWLNFRMRSMLMAVASYHLWLDWRDTGMILARRFTDYEPGIHWSQVQMQSGTTGMNTVRVYNPVKQGYDQDPEGVFTRRWVPELTHIAPEYLQEPWRRGGWNGYRAPIVDVKAAGARARDQIWSMRKGSAFRSEAQTIVQKHASRKKDRGLGRTAKPKSKIRQDGAQMSFDL